MIDTSSRRLTIFLLPLLFCYAAGAIQSHCNATGCYPGMRPRDRIKQFVESCFIYLYFLMVLLLFGLVLGLTLMCVCHCMPFIAVGSGMVLLVFLIGAALSFIFGPST
jgi:F0F1-type ATP synthase membrane subunit c/vacuolar-type H+-ATPase subunit K